MTRSAQISSPDVRVLERMGGIGVEEPAAVGAELLDALLGGERAHRQRLRVGGKRFLRRIAGRILERVARRVGLLLLIGQRLRRAYILVGAEVLDHTLRHERNGEHQRERHQDIECRAREIHPHVADSVRTVAREPADQRNRHHNAAGSREEVLHREPEHLREIAHRRLAGVSLPVGVGGEAHGGVEGRVRRERGKLLRIEWQPHLQPLQRVNSERADQGKHQQPDGVLLPAHLPLGIDAAQPVDPVLERRTRAQRPDRASVEDVRHVEADRLHAHEREHKKADDQRPRSRGHQNFSGRKSAYSR